MFPHRSTVSIFASSKLVLLFNNYSLVEIGEPRESSETWLVCHGNHPVLWHIVPKPGGSSVGWNSSSKYCVTDLGSRADLQGRCSKIRVSSETSILGLQSPRTIVLSLRSCRYWRSVEMINLKRHLGNCWTDFAMDGVIMPSITLRSWRRYT